MLPVTAAAWFLRDMAEVSGYAVKGWTEDRMLSVYSSYRPMLTAPDPWYFAGVVALEAATICDLFEGYEADDLLRHISEQMDSAIGRRTPEASTLAFMLMGRLGMGSLVMNRRPPDTVFAKVMLIMMGSAKSSAKRMPDPAAHQQLRAALKLGMPMWWKLFRKAYALDIEKPKPKRARIIPMAKAA
jgi:hypothetical protein